MEMAECQINICDEYARMENRFWFLLNIYEKSDCSQLYMERWNIVRIRFGWFAFRHLVWCHFQQFVQTLVTLCQQNIQEQNEIAKYVFPIKLQKWQQNNKSSANYRSEANKSGNVLDLDIIKTTNFSDTKRIIYLNLPEVNEWIIIGAIYVK